MRLVLRALHCHPADPRLHLTCVLDRTGGVVGRHPSCALALCPEDRHVSREHVRLRADDRGFVLSVVSRVNGVEIDSRPVPPGGSAALAGGEHLGLGGYLVLVEVERQAQVEAQAEGQVEAQVEGQVERQVVVPLEGPAAPDSASFPAGIGDDDGPPLDALFAALDDWAPPPVPRGRDMAPAAAPAPELAPFAAALGLSLDDLDTQRPAETLALAGALLRASLEGLHRQLETRGRTRRDLRLADRTAVATRANNPMKHAASAHEAVRHLVDLRQHGSALFMPPLRAVTEAVDDVVAHEAALIAGLRGTLVATLRAFAPDEVERRIRRSGALDGVLPALHKARLWDRFTALHAELAREAGESFERVTIEAFAQGYERAARAARDRRGPEVS